MDNQDGVGGLTGVIFNKSGNKIADPIIKLKDNNSPKYIVLWFDPYAFDNRHMCITCFTFSGGITWYEEPVPDYTMEGYTDYTLKTLSTSN